jgi:predicted dehydrogenase
MTRTIRFGIIGAGLMGREFASAAARWLHLLDLDFRPEIVAVCDTDEGRAGWFRDRVVPAEGLHRDYRELLARDDVDAVYCAVPHDLHERMYIDILQAGKHLFGEKPFGIDRAANQAIMAEVKRHPNLVVRCSSEFPFWPGAMRVIEAIKSGRLGRIIEVRAAFLHSSDLDPNKPINWKRMVEKNGEYGVMGDLGMHVLHIPIRLGWIPTSVSARLSNIITERPDGRGGVVPCETWDNAMITAESEQGFPMLLEVKRIAPGEMDTWSLEVIGTSGCARFSTKQPKTYWYLDYEPGGQQAWSAVDLGYRSAYPSITGDIFEFGFTDAILQMWAAYCDEVTNGEHMRGSFRCATAEEATLQHDILMAALDSHKTGRSVDPRAAAALLG